MRTIVDFSETEGAGALCLLVDRQTGRIWLFYIYCPEGAGAAEICKRKPKTETPVMQTNATPGQVVPTPRAVGEGFEPLPKTPGNTAIALRGSAKCSALFDETLSSDPILSELITLWPQLAASVREALLQQATQSLARGP